MVGRCVTRTPQWLKGYLPAKKSATPIWSAGPSGRASNHTEWSFCVACTAGSFNRKVFLNKSDAIKNPSSSLIVMDPLGLLMIKLLSAVIWSTGSPRRRKPPLISSTNLRYVLFVGNSVTNGLVDVCTTQRRKGSAAHGLVLSR